MAILRASFHAEDGFARLHEIEFVTRQQLRIGGIILQQRQFLALLVIAGSFLFHLLLQILQSMLLTLPFLHQRQKPANQENEGCHQNQEIDDPGQERADPVIPGFVVITVFRGATHSAHLTSILCIVT
jgi:hypothetical protein